ncbi:class I SAM-dependent methyltransferase [Rhodoferax sp.]|uniref:class I SAM-dependent methyltransferase n=1 Tax=Rhodoferax sp. TaxID=50421 RepID=UPI002600E035|nr:class I SAM-dependent methyltransferase [Rhodoferax sp.]
MTAFKPDSLPRVLQAQCRIYIVGASHDYSGRFAEDLPDEDVDVQQVARLHDAVMLMERDQTHQQSNERSGMPDAWIDKYIFPNGDLPSIGQMGDAFDALFVVEDLHSFSADYDKTLMAWCANFKAAWPRFSEQFGERLYRMWRYCLLSCVGAFRARDIQLWQSVLSKGCLRGGYQRP